MRVCLSKSIWWNDQSMEGANSILMVFSSNYASLVIHVQGRSVGHSHSLSVLHLFLINRHSNFYKATRFGNYIRQVLWECVDMVPGLHGARFSNLTKIDILKF
jgi:hypothetical protein